VERKERKIEHKCSVLLKTPRTSKRSFWLEQKLMALRSQMLSHQRLLMRRRSYFGVCKLRGNFKPSVAFQRSEEGLIAGIRSWKIAFVWLSSMSETHWWYLCP
jgi:hypothetical protein